MALRLGGFSMKDWSADKIIALGITISLIITVIGADIVAVQSGDMGITSLGKELVIGLFGYMGGGAIRGYGNQSTQSVTPNQSQNSVSKVLNTVASTADNVATTANSISDTANKVTNTAQTAQTIVNAIDNLRKDIKK